jgi:hypothetical protein
MSKTNDLFDNLVKNLRKKGYKVAVSLHNGIASTYKYASIEGKEIRGGFAEPNDLETYAYIDGKVCFDNKKCFDKWSKCPYSFPIPATEQAFEYLLSKMEYLASPEGYKKSNEFECQCEDSYPANIIQ